MNELLIFVLGFASPIALVLLFLGVDELHHVWGQYQWRRKLHWGEGK